MSKLVRTVLSISTINMLLILHTAARYPETSHLDNFVEDVQPGRQVDIVFVIDQSANKDETKFYSEGRKLVGAILKQYVAIHQDYARVAIITFSGDNQVLLDHIKVNDTAVTKCDFFHGRSVTPWNQVKYQPDMESSSGKKLEAPLQQVRDIFTVGKLHRPNAKQILLLLTDGNYDDINEAKEQGKLLKQGGVIIYTCGIGSPAKYDTRLRFLATKYTYYGSYEDWYLLLTTRLTSYTSDTLPQWFSVDNDDLCQPSCPSHAVCQCDILRSVVQCQCDKGYYLLKNTECTACQVGMYKDTTGDHDCEYCPSMYVTDERDDCYCQTNETGCVDKCRQDDICPEKHVCQYLEDGQTRCECRVGWSGSGCQTNLDNCIGNNCGEKCVDMLDTYACIELIPPIETTSRLTTTAPPSGIGYVMPLTIGLSTVVVVSSFITLIIVLVTRSKKNQPGTTSSVTAS